MDPMHRRASPRRTLLAAVVTATGLIASLAVPAAADGITAKAVVAGGSHSCVLASDGTAWCWGQNGSGQLGDGTQTGRLRAVQVKSARGVPLTGITAITAGFTLTCARTSSGTAWCWGSNSHGQLGDGSTTARPRAVRVTKLGGAPLTGVTAVSAGYRHSCARTDDGTAWCWGANEYGQLGDGTRADRLGAVRVTRGGGGTLAGVVSVSAGPGFHSCARTSDGAAWCWGYNAYGQLGDGTLTDRFRAVRVTRLGGGALTGVAAVSAGSAHTCARTDRGAAWCWGANEFGRLGDGTQSFRFGAVRVTRSGGENLTGVTMISAGQHRSCARSKDGVARCWGLNNYGQIGDGTTIDRYRAVRVKTSVSSALGGVTSVSTGDFHGCARTTAGVAWCWGFNSDGQVGDGSTTDRHLAVRVVATWAVSP